MREKLAAACDSCERTYRVPDATKTYNCKACEGGRVRVLPSPSPPRKPACADCGVALRADANFCVSCGTPAPTTAPGKTAIARDSRRTAHKRLAWLEITRTAKQVTSYRVSYMLEGIVGSLVMLGFVVFIPTVLDTFADALPGLLICATVFAVFVVGLMYMQSNPSHYIRGFASPWEHAMHGRWRAVIPNMQLNKLIKQHPDLYIEYLEQQAEEERAAGGAKGARRKRERSKKRLAKTCSIVLGIYVVTLLVGYVFHARTQIPNPEGALANFAAAWSRNDADEVAGLSTGKGEAACRKRLNDSAAWFKWKSWPPLIPVDKNVAGRKIEVQYDIGLEAGNMHVHWGAVDGHWVLANIVFPTASAR